MHLALGLALIVGALFIVNALRPKQGKPQPRFLQNGFLLNVAVMAIICIFVAGVGLIVEQFAGDGVQTARTLQSK